MAMKQSTVDEQWTAFTESTWSPAVTHSVFELSFPSQGSGCESIRQNCLTVDHSLWSRLEQDACSPQSSLISRPPEAVVAPLELPGDCEQFDWTTNDCIEVVPSLFKPAKPESPIDIHFDHSRAALGLSTLTLEELRAMSEEMRSKFSRLSRVLVDGLEERDGLVSELDIKNRFVAAILRVQTLRVSDDSSRRKQGTEKKYLDYVLPYHPPNGLAWTADVLSMLTNILQAIVEHSDRVPLLVADYIQEHILQDSANWTEH